MNQWAHMETEISEWADITHEPEEKPMGGTYFAHDKASGDFVGKLAYFFLNDDHTEIQFQDVWVDKRYRRRKVAKALLRHLNYCHPDARINPGVRNTAGAEFMKHILATEKEKVATNGILQVPLRMMMPPGFRPGDAQARYGVNA